jgi:hypothetical protein
MTASRALYAESGLWRDGARRPPGENGARSLAITRSTPSNRSRPNAYSDHQRRRRSRAGAEGSGAHRSRARRRGRGRRARDGPVGRGAFPVAARPAAPAQGLAQPLRREGHADRLRHHGRAPHPRRPAARSGALRRQPWPERRRGRDLFGHHRRRHGGHDPRNSVLRPVAGLRPDDRAQRSALGLRGDPRAGPHPQADERGAAAGYADQPQFPRLPGRRRAGRRGDDAGQARRQAAEDRAAPRRPRPSVLLDRLRTRLLHARRRHRSRSGRGEENFGDAAAARPDGRRRDGAARGGARHKERGRGRRDAG